MNFDLIREGGIGAYAAILLGMLGLLLGALAIVAMLGKSRSAFSLGIAALVVSTATAGAGMLGTVYGRYQVKRALAFVSSEVDVERIMRQGFREAQQASWVGLFAALLPLALGAAAAFVGSRMQQPRSRVQGFAEPVVSSDDGVGGQSMIALIFIGLAALASGGAYAMANTELPKLRFNLPDDDHDSWALVAALDEVKSGKGSDGCDRLSQALEPFWEVSDRTEWPRTLRRPISSELTWRAAADGCAKKIFDSFEGEPRDPAWSREQLLESPLLWDDALHAKLLTAQTKDPAPIEQDDDEAATGIIAKEAIRRSIQRELKGIRNCYERELTSDPSLTGKVMVQFTIGLEGTVTSASDVSVVAFPSQKVVACILERFKAMKFPKPEGGVVRVNYPLIFKSAE